MFHNTKKSEEPELLTFLHLIFSHVCLSLVPGFHALELQRQRDSTGSPWAGSQDTNRCHVDGDSNTPQITLPWKNKRNNYVTCLRKAVIGTWNLFSKWPLPNVKVAIASTRTLHGKFCFPIWLAQGVRIASMRQHWGPGHCDPSSSLFFTILHQSLLVQELFSDCSGPTNFIQFPHETG